MKLRRIEIENFRGFAHPVEIDVDDFTALIGRNDIGKSSVLSALTIFLEGDGVKIDSDDGAINGDKTQVRISCEFDGYPGSIVLDDQFETSLASERLLTGANRLRITKIFDCSKSKIAPEVFIEADEHPVDQNGESLIPLTLAELKKRAVEYGVALEVGEATVKAKIRQAIANRSAALTPKSVRIPVSKNDSKTLWDQLIRVLPICALFVSDRASSEKDKEAQTPMGIAVEAALNEIQDKLDDISLIIETRVQDVANRTLAKLQEMNPELAGQLQASLREKPKWKDLFKYTLNSDQGVPIDKRGSGVRRLVLLNFFRAEAERRALNEGGRPIIYAIEEPETAQHPDHQKILVKALIEIASKGGQVILTTHAPGLAGELPTPSLRFLDAAEDGRRVIRSVATEDANNLFVFIAERLGMLPDNQVRVLICVEGANDVRFLKAVSCTLSETDASIPDLSRDPRFVFVPMKGGNLIDVVNLHIFKNFRKPEFHIYDQDEGQTYADQAAEVNARGDGSKAVQTKKRYMESYVHADALDRTKGVKLVIDDSIDYTPQLAGLLGVKKAEAKAILSCEVAPAMSVEEIDEADGTGEIRSWLIEISAMAA
ncbi:ATP-binding protein [Rhodoferax mekongensis]|uniref:ATP-binding protein n=1 Tax=Rhodoferax mekongensis TaxID=3068341 RepID=A0ABZ0B1K3_9BURK|nr:ATP-binding protein [Rhodoferax sp. TBRC 17307]WNO05766.1 ATP-binding protein [Rhodoferax sp. TBRC 17307]